MQFEVVDKLTEYFNYVQDEITNEQRTNKYLELWAEEFAKIVDETIPRWNPNLRYSGLDSEFWEIHRESDFISDITILYTGFTGEGKGAPDDIQVWWEFGKYHRGGYGDILARDYASYQEYGEDKYAPVRKYKAPDFEGHHYVESGLYTFEELIEYHAGDYLMQILNK